MTEVLQCRNTNFLEARKMMKEKFSLDVREHLESIELFLEMDASE